MRKLYFAILVELLILMAILIVRMGFLPVFKTVVVQEPAQVVLEQEKLVYYTMTGSCYHRVDCRYIVEKIPQLMKKRQPKEACVPVRSANPINHDLDRTYFGFHPYSIMHMVFPSFADVPPTSAAGTTRTTSEKTAKQAARHSRWQASTQPANG